MRPKTNDRNVTAEIVEAMSPQGLKAFENRLRALAFKQDFEIRKYRVFPDNKLVYALIDKSEWGSGKPLEKGGYDLTILELRDYLYEVK